MSDDGEGASSSEPWEWLAYKKPLAEVDRQKNRRLRRLATRGVVRLFNAVKEHKSDVREQLKGQKTSAGRERVVRSMKKSYFFGRLYKDANGNDGGGQVVKTETDELTEMIDPSASSSWDVLRADFLSASKSGCSKDWDRTVDSE